MAATSKTSKQQERDNNKQHTGKATCTPKPPNKRKRTEKAKELPTRQLVDETEQEEEEPLVRKTVKRGPTTTSSNPPSKGIEIREPVPYQSQSSKQNDPNDKGKQKAIAESESESDSDDELPLVDMSDEDEGEPIDRAAWVPHIPTDRFDSMCKIPDYAHIKSVLCPTRKDADWKHGSVEYHSLAKEFMSTLVRAVLNFLCNRLMPCQHKTDVPRHRALVLCALLEGIPLNLGVIMHDQMQRTRMNYKWRLFFANTLSAYLTEMGVKWDKENDDIEAKAPAPYGVTQVLEPNKGRSSKLTIQQLSEQLQADMQENMAELIVTRAELSATRAELIQTRADLSRVQAEQATVMREVSLLLRALVERTDIDIS
ncbi:hypothetical protein A4A49_32550 [Nicotiana attenuata]|uniref:Putative plant transposon protein domain-containing protein n=1 Tax=Nicotiana attenuata TaxID=49451 RepID=A0A1J6IK61_NICAT|nr:hypothetical protein A4A49_32550 [Nicotiana attenuata]